MKRIRGKDTGPELVVRALLARLGYTGYRLHRRDLPGRPDIAFIGRRKAIFVHGCFWHSHPACKDAPKPKSNASYWGPKLERTVERDAEKTEALRERGWAVEVVWECELRKPEQFEELGRRLADFIED